MNDIATAVAGTAIKSLPGRMGCVANSQSPQPRVKSARIYLLSSDAHLYWFPVNLPVILLRSGEKLRNHGALGRRVRRAVCTSRAGWRIEQRIRVL